MGAVEYALKYIINTLDETVLELAFREKHRTINNILSIEEKVRTQVILSKVINDVKVLSGIRKNIPLSKCRIKQLGDSLDFIIEVPDKLVSNREIVSASSISLPSSSKQQQFSGNPLIDTASAIMGSFGSSPIIEVTRLEVIGKNIIMVITEGYENDLSNGYLECTVSSGENMSHINPRNHRDFGMLCLEAVKSMIHTKLYVKLDEGYVKGGHNISRIKDVVDKYEDAEDAYQEKLDGWEKIERLNNRKFVSDFIGLQCGST